MARVSSHHPNSVTEVRFNVAADQVTCQTGKNGIILFRFWNGHVTMSRATESYTFTGLVAIREILLFEAVSWESLLPCISAVHERIQRAIRPLHDNIPAECSSANVVTVDVNALLSSHAAASVPGAWLPRSQVPSGDLGSSSSGHLETLLDAQVAAKSTASTTEDRGRLEGDSTAPRLGPSRFPPLTGTLPACNLPFDPTWRASADPLDTLNNGFRVNQGSMFGRAPISTISRLWRGMYELDDCVVLHSSLCADGAVIGPFSVIRRDPVAGLYEIYFPPTKFRRLAQEDDLKPCGRKRCQLLQAYQQNPTMPFFRKNDRVNIKCSWESCHTRRDLRGWLAGNPYRVRSVDDRGLIIIVSERTGKKVRIHVNALELYAEDDGAVASNHLATSPGDDSAAQIGVKRRRNHGTAASPTPLPTPSSKRRVWWHDPGKAADGPWPLMGGEQRGSLLPGEPLNLLPFSVHEILFEEAPAL